MLQKLERIRTYCSEVCAACAIIGLVVQTVALWYIIHFHPR